MKVLYVSSYCSGKVIDALFQHTGRNPGYNVQKFSRLICSGLIYGGDSVEALSPLPAAPGEPPLLCRVPDDSEHGVRFHYIPFINITLVRSLCIFLYSFFFVLRFGMTRRREKRVVCDVLQVGLCMGAVLAARLTGLHVCGVMTDMPSLMVDKVARSLKARIGWKIFDRYIGWFSSYVFLTEAMAEAVNRHKRPYIVMEGLVDSSVNGNPNANPNNSQNNNLHSDQDREADRESNRETDCGPDCERGILYAGGLYAQYGVKMLIDAFMAVGDPDLRLHLYGSGDMAEEIRRLSVVDPRIQYHGVAPNSEIVEVEKRMLLLVNPRPTGEDFVKYSFPSKNMEYMLSGTAVATTRLPGMPDDYLPYVYLLEEESVEGYARALREILALGEGTLRSKGAAARRFVLAAKSERAQALRIHHLLFQN